MKTLLVIMMLALAACVDHGVRPSTLRTVADSADQVMAGFTTTITRDGLRTSYVVSDSAWIYQARQIVDLKRMTVTMFDSTGATVAVITADKGIYGIQQQSLDARGNVIARTPGNKVLKTEHLVYDQSRNEIRSDTAFTSTSPTENLRGDNFTSDPAFKHVTVFRPKGGEKGKKGFPLPGQKP